jgi:hypothetical protein
MTGDLAGHREVPNASKTRLGPELAEETSHTHRWRRDVYRDTVRYTCTKCGKTVTTEVGQGPLLPRIEEMLATSCAEQFASDVARWSASFYPLPTDTGFEPAVVLYVMLPGRGDEPGVHMMQFETPYGLTHAYVKDFADRTAEERQRLRQAREEGKPETPGLALGLGTV